MDNKRAARLINSVILVVGIVLIVGSLVYLGCIMWQYHKGTAEYDALKEQVFLEAEQEHPSKPAEGEETSKPQESVPDWVSDVQVQSALLDLAEQNPDTVGWIVFDNMDISYPVMLGTDDVYYLDHTFSGEVNSAGSIFMEAQNHADFQDCHTILYGHNMKNLSMFGKLKNYKKQDFYEGNEYFTIYTPDAVLRYQIFSYYDISEDSDVYSVGFQPDQTFQSFVETCLRRSYYDTGVSVSKQDKIITLSTCSAEGQRFVVHAKRIEEYWG